jgi:hypothetical protein
MKKALDTFLDKSRGPPRIHPRFANEDGSVGGTAATDVKRSPKSMLLRGGEQVADKAKLQTQVVNQGILDDMYRRKNRITNLLNEL